jgi:hypothetical protein
VCKLQGSWGASDLNRTHDVCHFILCKLLITNKHVYRTEIMHYTLLFRYVNAIMLYRKCCFCKNKETGAYTSSIAGACNLFCLLFYYFTYFY